MTRKLENVIFYWKFLLLSSNFLHVRCVSWSLGLPEFDKRFIETCLLGWPKINQKFDWTFFEAGWIVIVFNYIYNQINALIISLVRNLILKSIIKNVIGWPKNSRLWLPIILKFAYRYLDSRYITYLWSTAAKNSLFSLKQTCRKGMLVFSGTSESWSSLFWVCCILSRTLKRTKIHSKFINC